VLGTAIFGSPSLKLAAPNPTDIILRSDATKKISLPSGRQEGCVPPATETHLLAPATGPPITSGMLSTNTSRLPVSVEDYSNQRPSGEMEGWRPLDHQKIVRPASAKRYATAIRRR
jgi:hypothetical protein